MLRFLIVFPCALLTFVLGFVSGPLLADEGGSLAVLSELGPLIDQPAAALLLGAAQRAGRIGVIVGVDLALQDEDALSPEATLAQQRKLSQAQDALVARATGGSGVAVRKFETVPYVALHVTRSELARLLADPAVTSITEDTTLEFQIDESTDIIRATDLWRKEGIKGDGQVIAVLDSGVDPTHSMLKDKVVSEACYSTTGLGFRSLCPNGANQSTALHSGDNCKVTIPNCDHGTYVASIAAGANDLHRGVAPRAKIIAIKIASKRRCGGSWCLRTQESDIIRALERVYKLRKTFTIAAVNLSVAAKTLSPLDCDALYPSMKDIVNKLRGAGIATVAATGNEGADNEVGFPACLSQVVAVAATTKFDNFWNGSNYASNVDLMAPGKDIMAAVPAGSPCAGSGKYCTYSGTSAAAPHVAGAFALMRQAYPEATIGKIVSALNCTGKQIERLQLQRPRIDVLKGYRELVAADPSERYPFDSADELDDWTQRLGHWGVAGGKLVLNTWPTSGGPYDWAFIAHEYCSSSFKVKALIHYSGLSGTTGLLLASNIEKTGSSVAVSGYYVTYGDNNITVARYDNFPVHANVGIQGQGVSSFCYPFGIPIGWNASLPHIVEMSVTKDGRYSVDVDGEWFCKFTDRFHPPPSKVAVIASKAKDDDGSSGVMEVRIVSFTPIN